MRQKLGLASLKISNGSFNIVYVSLRELFKLFDESISLFRGQIGQRRWRQWSLLFFSKEPEHKWRVERPN